MSAVTIHTLWCKGCGICVAFCPTGSLSLVAEKAVYNPEKCVVCGLCALYCPDLAIAVDQSKKQKKAQQKEVA